MGNRANVVFEADGELSPTVYLHWNGGPESVYAFLEELEARKIRPDACYEAARFCQLVGEFFDHSEPNGLSLGLAAPPQSASAEDIAAVPTDPGDNGFYVVNRKQKAVRRFVTVYGKNGNPPKVRKLSAQRVQQERSQALTDPQYKAIRKWFDRFNTTIPRRCQRER